MSVHGPLPDFKIDKKRNTDKNSLKGFGAAWQSVSIKVNISQTAWFQAIIVFENRMEKNDCKAVN